MFSGTGSSQEPEFSELPDEGEQQDDDRDIEEGVRHCDVALDILRNRRKDVSRRGRVDEVEKNRDPFRAVGNVEQNQHHQRPEDVEQSVRERRLFRHRLAAAAASIAVMVVPMLVPTRSGTAV